MKTHDLKSVVIGGNEFSYFYTREKNDINGNPRFRVYIIDPDGPVVHETIFKCYESQISECAKTFITTKIGLIIPF